MQIKKSTKTITGIFAAAFLFSTVLFSCNDSSTSTTTTTDSPTLVPATTDSMTVKNAPDTMHKTDSSGIDTTKGGQNPPPRQK